MKQTVIEANSDVACACCGRYHRKLRLVNGYWLGSTCQESYEIFRWNKDRASIQWKGYEKKFDQLARMVAVA